MNKNLLALAISAAAFGTQVSAVELYNQDGNTFSIGGHLTGALTASESADASVTAVSPRVNINATHQVNDQITVDTRAEWSINMLEGGDNALSTRLGYVGATHEDLGRVVVGTQWAPYYNAAGVADLPIAYANNFIYDNAGKLGTGRGDKMVSYSNAQSFGEAGELAYALAWQGDANIKEDKTIVESYGDRAQIALNYYIADFSVNYAFNTGDVNYQNVSGGSVTAQSNLVSASYGSYGQEDNVYVSAVIAMNDYMNVYSDEALKDTTGYEALAAYVVNGVNLSVHFESVVDNDSDETVFAKTALQAEYNFTPKFVGFAGYQFDHQGSGDYKESSDNSWMVGGRFYL
ncbi:hypothetical protein BCU68_03235 [Vibrio sp. 10N.286.49.B3]|uniref:porin n=1 Tax=Vibrio sp. 10N.286.49.B3 TaxID=1880855 RepID=UPI000C846E74|nr:porin [Vibrio sp. 10N.286.49.B3]PMH44528.1 hypothetical protein BCU68_03235 [Vibrio sp. 10N.286.49.B3]